MIIFTQLRISDDGKKLYINAQVNKSSYFSGVTIKGLYIMTSDKVSETSPNIPTEDCIYTKTYSGAVTEINEVLTVDNFINFSETDLTKTLFFVYIKCDGTVGENTSTTLTDKIVLGVTFDENMLYQSIMNYTKEILAIGNTPAGFIDFILLWNAFKASVETEHYVPAIMYFNKLFNIVDKAYDSNFKNL